MKQQATRCPQRTRRAMVPAVSALALLLAVAVSPVAAQYQQLPESVQPEESAFDYEALDLRVAVWLDKGQDEVYRKGDDLGVGFQANADAYAVVYRVDTEGVVTVLWPRSPLDDGFVFGGHEYNLPVTGSRRLRVSTSEGEGFVQAIVSRYPFDLRHLELDFHHEHRAETVAFQVAGDPYLAMNEVNYAITGLEDSGDYVVTNHVAYYVHREVEHPRYLCNQCHFEDDSAYHPYRDQCSLQITVDHSWDNGWWDSYGYYPVYYNPVYVYTDPWTWRPWINFWYTPHWRCPPVMVCDWYSPVYVWVDHPNYRGDCNMVWRDGAGRSRPPLTMVLADGPRSKIREYGQVTGMVDPRGPRKSGGRVVKGDAGTAYQGKKAIRRPDERFEQKDLRDGNHGLRIHPSSGGRRTDTAGEALRHTAGNKSQAPTRIRTGSVASSPTRMPGVGKTVRGASPDPALTRGSGSTIRTVEPRRKGTRIWNTQPGGSRKQRPGTVRPTENGRTGQRTRPDGTVGRSGTSNRKTPTVNRGTGAAKSRSGSSKRSSGSTVRSGGSKSGSGSSKATRGGSTAGKTSSKTRSGSSKKSGSSTKSGGSGKSGGGGSAVRSSGSSSRSGSSGTAAKSRSGGGSSRNGSRSGSKRK